MGETDLHRDWMVRILELLKCRESGILRHLEAGELVMTDSQTGRRLLTGEEAAEEAVRRLHALLEGKDAGS